MTERFIKPAKAKRVQIDMTPSLILTLECLKESIEASTNSEAIRRAVKICAYLATMSEEGYTIEMKKGDERVSITEAFLL